jgi:hypothetical protein
MKKDTRNALFAIAAIALVVVGLNQFGYISLFPPFSTTGGGTGPTGGGQTIDSTMRSNYLNGVGQFQMNTKIYNTLVAATSYTVATQQNIYYYHFLQGRWSLGVTASAGTDLFDAKPEDNGYMWVVVVPTTWKFYVDYQKIMQNDPYIVSYQYVDVDGTGTKRFAFQYNLKNHAIPSSGYPIISFVSYATAYCPPDFADALDGVNTTAIGATLTQRYFNWYLNLTENNGTALYKVELIAGNATVPITDLTIVSLKKLQIPGLGYLDGSQFTQTFTTQDIRWTYTASNSLDHAIYLGLLANQNNRFDMNGQLEFLLGATAAVPITLNIYYLTAPTGSGASITETFYACLA